jgi:hypothetical protein
MKLAGFSFGSHEIGARRTFCTEKGLSGSEAAGQNRLSRLTKPNFQIQNHTVSKIRN